MLLLRIHNDIKDNGGSGRKKDKVDEMIAAHDPEVVPDWLPKLPAN